MPESGPWLVLIRFGENQYKRDLPFAKLIHKFEIIGLRRMPAVDQYKQTDQVLSFPDIGFDHILPVVSGFLRNFGISVSGKIDNIPFLLIR